MIKSPLRYPGGKSRAVETIAGLLPDFDEFREPFLGGGYDLKSRICITAGEPIAVACGNKKERNFCLKGRTNIEKSFALSGRFSAIALPQATAIALPEIIKTEPFGLYCRTKMLII